jgi:hypothetical protein
MKLILNIFLIAVFILPVSATKPKRTETQSVEDDGTVKTVVTEEWTDQKEFKGRGRGDIIVMTNDDNDQSEHSNQRGDHDSSVATSYQGSDDQQCVNQCTTKCNEQQQSFSDQCLNKYGGVVHGGQCFFLAKQCGQWNKAWAACAQRGGQLAHVHTRAEFADITKYLQKTCNPQNMCNNDGVWTALYREPGAANPGFYLNMDATHWYIAPNQMHERLTAGNSWIRTRSQDCPFRPDWYCIVIWGDYTAFGDHPCTIDHPALCQVTNENQKFTRAPNKCVSEVVIEKGSGSNPDACAKVCANFLWCRSFNFRKNNQTCEYFSLAIQDLPKTIYDENCQHFSYQF